MINQSAFHLLLADGVARTTDLFERALRCCPGFSLAGGVSNVSALVSYLAGTGEFVDRTRFPEPDLVLLDLNLSGRGSGFDVLQWIQDRETRRYRVVVLSGTADEAECEHAYSLGADGFVPKPVSLVETISVLARIEGWMNSSSIDAPSEFCVA